MLRQQLARVMLFALVVAALAPGLSRMAVAAQTSLAPWSVVCSVPAYTAGKSPHDSVHLLEHCAWCSLQADPMAPPPALSHGLSVVALRHGAPALRVHAPAPSQAWVIAQARAPPHAT